MGVSREHDRQHTQTSTKHIRYRLLEQPYFVYSKSSKSAQIFRCKIFAFGSRGLPTMLKAVDSCKQLLQGMFAQSRGTEHVVWQGGRAIITTSTYAQHVGTNEALPAGRNKATVEQIPNHVGIE